MTYSIGDHVASSSGLVYIIKELVTLDLVGTTAYRARRLRGGIEWGPTRILGEANIWPEAGAAGNHGQVGWMGGEWDR